MPYRMRDVEQIVAEFAADGQPYAVFVDNNLGSRPDYLRALCRALRPLERIWSAAVTIDVTDDPALVREMALAGCTGVFVGFESLHDRATSPTPRKKTPRARRLRAPRRDPARQRHPGERQLRARLRPRPTRTSSSAPSSGSRRTGSSARRSTSSRRIPARRCSRRWRPRAGCCTATGRSTTRRTSSSEPRHMTPEAARGGLRLVLPAAVLARARSGGGARRTGAPCCRTWRCRISTSARTGSGIS